MTSNFKCIKRRCNCSGRGKVAEGGRRDREIKKRETDEVKRGDLSMCVCVCVHVRACICPPAVVSIPGKIDCLPRIICPRHQAFPFLPFSPLRLQSTSYSSPLSLPFLTLVYLLALCSLPVAVTSPSCRSTPSPPKPSAPLFLPHLPTSHMTCFLHLDTRLHRRR